MASSKTLSISQASIYFVRKSAICIAEVLAPDPVRLLWQTTLLRARLHGGKILLRNEIECI